MVPLPPDANDSSSGRAFACATRSATVRIGCAVPTTSTCGMVPIKVTGAKAPTGSYAIFCSRFGTMACGPIEVPSSV